MLVPEKTTRETDGLKTICLPILMGGGGGGGQGGDIIHEMLFGTLIYLGTISINL